MTHQVGLGLICNHLEQIGEELAFGRDLTTAPATSSPTGTRAGIVTRRAFETRAALRSEHSRRLVEKIRAFTPEERVLPQSSLGKALAYMHGLWPGLVRFLDDPRIALDNNATERALRGAVLGRKNHYGSRSQLGTEVAALFYGLIETAKLVAVDPRRYLLEATRAALREQSPLLPHHFVT